MSSNREKCNKITKGKRKTRVIRRERETERDRWDLKREQNKKRKCLKKQKYKNTNNNNIGKAPKKRFKKSQKQIKRSGPYCLWRKGIRKDVRGCRRN